MSTNTDCRKCKSAMPPTASPAKDRLFPFDRLKMTITGYRCPNCDHWNNLKTRKPRKPERK